MPLRLEIRKKLSARCERVKSVDIHPTESWLLAGLYSGHCYIWDYEAESLNKSIDVSELPVRCAKFVARKQWFIAGADDMRLRVYNYNTMEKVREWEAHGDYIRYVEIHPTRSLILSSSDDMTIKMWDWDQGFDCMQVFEGHAHYVMMIKINPRDANTFASASLDRSIKVWGLTASTPHFSLEGHERGVNSVDYYPGGDKPYLVSGADDRTVKVWDYQTRSCLQTLEGHTHNVSAVLFHPRLPLIASAAEDGTVRLWHSTTYRAESTLNYGFERAWCLAATRDAHKLAIGYDDGAILLKLGHEKPVASLDPNTGRLVWARGHEIQTVSLRGVAEQQEAQDGEQLSLNPRDLGSCEVYPQALAHNSNGHFIVVCGDGEYIIYTSQALRNKAFGSALDFVWSKLGTGDYAIRESISRVKLFKNFKSHTSLRLPMASADGLFGGVCLGVQGPDCVVFFDWEDGELIRRIDVTPIDVHWNESGELVLIACAEQYYVLRFNREAVANAIAAGTVSAEDGVPEAFDVIGEYSDRIRTGQWVGDCFLYTNASGRLNYFVGGEVLTLFHLDHPMYLLGYIPRENRAYLIDKAYNVVSQRILLSVLQFQTAVVRRDFETANSILPSIPASEHAAVARFLESQGLKEEALSVTPDPDQKFDLAIELGKLDIAREILEQGVDGQDKDSTDYQTKWRRLGDLALRNGDLELAERCASFSKDLSGLLLLYSSNGNYDGMVKLAKQAQAQGRFNVAFAAYLLTGRVEGCIDLLMDTNRLPEAAFLARTYLPSEMPRVVSAWKEDLSKISTRAADSLADPDQYPNLFPDLDLALRVEAMFRTQRENHIPASMYPTAKDDLDLNLIELVKAQIAQQQAAAAAAAADADADTSTDAADAAADATPTAPESEDQQPEAEAEAGAATSPSPTATPPPAPTPVEETAAAAPGTPTAAQEADQSTTDELDALGQSPTPVKQPEPADESASSPSTATAAVSVAPATSSPSPSPLHREATEDDGEDDAAIAAALDETATDGADAAKEVPAADDDDIEDFGDDW